VRRTGIRSIPLLLLLLLPAAVRAQEGAAFSLPDALHVDDVHAAVDGARAVEVYLRALTRYGEPVEKLRAGDLEVRDNGRRIPPEEIDLQAVGDTTRGVTCVLVIDASPTMAGATFESARSAAMGFLEGIGTHDRVAVVSFAGTPRLVAPFDVPHAEARRRLAELETDTSPAPTVLYDALQLAVEGIRNGKNLPRRTFVIVFSDGQDGGSSHSLDQVIEHSRGSQTRAHILMFAIGYARFGGAGLEALRKLAAATGGEFFDATPVRSLNSFYTSIWRQVTRSYVLRFPTPMDGGFHTLTVSIGDASDSHVVSYPRIARPTWQYALPAGLGVAVGLLVFVLLQRRSPGRLVLSGNDRMAETFVLRRGTTRIGALSENDVVIAEAGVSRKHAEIRSQGGHVELHDLRSTNGTFVNGAPIRSCRLRPGDKIRIGTVDVVFER
jgi:VWFA-related protein